MNLNKLQNKELLEKARSLVSEERKMMGEVIRCLEEINRRKLYLQLGYSSLFAFCTQELGYSESAAMRRINAMRMSEDVPEVIRNIEDGHLSLSNISKLQHFLNQEKKEHHKHYSINEKKEILNQMNHQSTRDCEKMIAGLNSHQSPPPERKKVLTPTQTLISFTASNELTCKLDKIKNLLSHKHPALSYAKLFSVMADHMLDSIDPEVKQRKLEERKLRQHKKQEQEQEQEQGRLLDSQIDSQMVQKKKDIALLLRPTAAGIIPLRPTAAGIIKCPIAKNSS